MSERITNLMAADRFFYPDRGFYAKRRVEAERFVLIPAKAKKLLKPASVALPKIEKIKKVVRKIPIIAVKSEIQFEEWQILLAEKIMKGQK